MTKVSTINDAEVDITNKVMGWLMLQLQCILNMKTVGTYNI